MPIRRGPTPKLQQQVERLSRLPRTKQRVVIEMLEGLLAQAWRVAWLLKPSAIKLVIATVA